MSLPPGSRIGPYQIGAPLGAGGMGEVYRATDTRLNREVAIKVIPDAFAQDADRMARFSRESQVLAALNHPNIAAIYGLEEHALVMELVEGRPLAGPLTVEEALPIVEQLIDALEYAHDKGIVHRDLKPANILVTSDGRVKVLDFGLAKAMSADRPASDPASSPTITMRSTVAGMIMGTAAYMSPEQARGHDVDKRSDIWSFGVVLYEILTGKSVFEGPTVSDSLAAVLMREPDIDAVPTRFRRLVRMCLVRDQRQRLRDISGARLLLAEPPPPTALRAPQQTRIPWLIAIVLAFALTATGALWWKATRPADRPLMRLSVDLGPAAVAAVSSSFLISPDGERIAYVTRTQIETRLLGQSQATRLAGTENAGTLFFSPDSQWIGFISEGKLKKTPAAGGPITVLCDVVSPRGASWAENGFIIVAMRHPGPQLRLFRVPDTGGTPQEVSPKVDALTQHRSPYVLPGAQAVLYVSSPENSAEDSVVEAASFQTGKVKTLGRGYAPRYASSGHVLFMRQGVLVAQRFDPSSLEAEGAPVQLLDDAANAQTGNAQYDLSRNGILVYRPGEAVLPGFPLAWVDRSGKAEPLAIEVGANLMPRVSPDGRQVLFVKQVSASDVWLHDVERGSSTRLTLDRKYNTFPVWAPDGKHFVYVSSDNGTHTIWWARADGAGVPQRLMDSKNRPMPTSFSPNGRRLAYHQAGAQAQLDIFTLPIDPTDPDHPKAGAPEPFLVSPAEEAGASFSPDGKWIAHTAADTGRIEVYVRPYPGPGGRWLVSTGGGDNSVWLRNGRSLVYRAMNGVVMEVDYQVKGDAFVAGVPRPWTTAVLPSLTGNGPRTFDISLDGNRLLIPYPVVAPEANKSNLHVNFLLNFSDELRRRVK